MRRNVVRGAQWAAAILILGFLIVGLSRQWHETWPKVRDGLAALDIHWLLIIIASIIVLGTYALLIETWRQVLAAWNRKLRWWSAAKVWFVSGLAKYIPGNVWSIAALGVMARERGASSAAAAGSSILITILNLISGGILVVVCSTDLIGNSRTMGLKIGAAVLAVAVIAATPRFLPPLAAWLCRVTGREIPVAAVPQRAIWIALGGTAVSWLLYGLAFYLFARALVGDAVHGSIVRYIGVYTFAYIFGFVTPVPAGVGVRELSLVKGLTALGLMSPADALIVAFSSRIWLTVLEVAPALIGLAVGQLRHRTSRMTRA